MACSAGRRLSGVLLRGGARVAGGISLLVELGDEHVRSVLLHEGVQLQAELAHGALRQSLQSHALLGPGHLLAMGGIGETAQLLGQLVDLLANLVGGGQGLGALGLDGRALIGRLLHTGARRLGGRARLVPHVGGDRQLAAAALLGPLGSSALVAFTPCGRPQRVGAPAAGALALLCRAQGEPGIGLGGTGLARSIRSGFALLSGSLQGALEAVGTTLPRDARTVGALGSLRALRALAPLRAAGLLRTPARRAARGRGSGGGVRAVRRIGR